MLIIILFAIAATKYIFSAIYIHSRRLKPRLPGAMQLRTCGHDFELPTIKYEYSTNKTLLFVQFLIMCDFAFFSCILSSFLLHCTHVRMSYVLNSYLLTYLLTHVSYISLKYRSRYQDSIGSLDLK